MIFVMIFMEKRNESSPDQMNTKKTLHTKKKHHS